MNKVVKLLKLGVVGLHKLWFIVFCFVRIICSSVYYFVTGQYRHGIRFTKIALVKFNGAATETLESKIEIENYLFGYRVGALERLKTLVHGLHLLLPSLGHSYSILIPVYKPHLVFFQKAVRAALDQSAPMMEILLGYDGPQPSEITNWVHSLLAADERARVIIREFHIDRMISGGGISNTTNYLAKNARNKFLLLMDHDDWIRPDLLYRYEQTMHLLKDPEGTVLFCNEYKINEKDEEIPQSKLAKPEQPTFPYLFINTICHCLLVPKKLWDQVGGLRPECDGAQDFDLCLRLDLQGAHFQNIPIYLYAWRCHTQSTAMSIDAKNYVNSAGIKALTDYVKQKGLNWKSVEVGYIPSSYRPLLPTVGAMYKVQVIIPYKDQKILTLKAVDHILKQNDIKCLITAVDNNSTDRSIAEELVSRGVEVLRIEEPFNFSRLNNLAAERSKYKREAEFILFLNNDVDLDCNAVSEMISWLQQPGVGIVGARLHYPDGRLQHGGVEVGVGDSLYVNWMHTDHHRPDQDVGFGKVLRACDAVTGACLAIRRSIFEKIGGFDEILYPIAFSDTDLCRRVRREGLHCLYTPFAFGVHHESVSRGYNAIEDLECSRWLFVNSENRQTKKAKLVANSEIDWLCK